MTEVDDFYDAIKKLSDLIFASSDFSNYIWQNDYFRRFLILVSANYFETEVAELLKNFAKTKSGDPLLISFLVKSTERQYYNYFDWNTAKNANTFFSYFGEDFSNKAKDDVKRNELLSKAILAFLEIGQTRNNLVHKQFLHFSLPKTMDEYYSLYREALVFMTYLNGKLIQ